MELNSNHPIRKREVKINKKPSRFHNQVSNLLKTKNKKS